jgi:3-deoxy-D-manno-octulosonic-acid transferase
MYGLYGALLRLAWAVVIPYQVVIGLVTGRPGPRLGERLVLGPAPPAGQPGGLWVHAVSVGEVRLALTVIAAVRRRWPEGPVHLTTGTETGRALALEAAGRAAAGAPDGVSALPLDLPGPMGRLIDRLRPRAILVIETEIWPNLIRQAAGRGVPVAIVNGRLSPRTFPRYRAARRLFAAALARVGLVAAQTREDADRFRALGTPTDRVLVTGNLKFDLPVPRADGDAVRRRLGFPPDATVFVAGSTARAEAAPVLAAYAALAAADGGARLVLAPRHPEDVAPAAAALEAHGIRYRRWSALDGTLAADRTATADRAAVLVDVMGVLPEIYAAANLAFVGGSLVPRGGQNLLEPAALGCPVLFGPRLDNVRAAADALIAAGGGFRADDAACLTALVLRLAGDPAARRAAGARARSVVDRERGALERTLDAAAALVAPAPPHGGRG